MNHKTAAIQVNGGGCMGGCNAAHAANKHLPGNDNIGTDELPGFRAFRLDMMQHNYHNWDPYSR